MIENGLDSFSWQHLTPHVRAGRNTWGSTSKDDEMEPKKLLRSFLHSTILSRRGLGAPKHPRVEKQDSHPRMSKKGLATSNTCWKIEIN